MQRLTFEENRLYIIITQKLNSIRCKTTAFLEKAKNINLISEDYLYKRNFIKKQLPVIYENHIKNGYLSCAFCTNLTRSHCHSHCLKCSAGTYIRCSPLLPGLMYNDRRNPGEPDNITVPWLYKNTCGKFSRLGSKQYLRNFKIPFSWETIYNYEILEGLTSGYSVKERPCFICATIDYAIYRKCLDMEGFDRYTPCSRISSVVKEAYKTVS